MSFDSDQPEKPKRDFADNAPAPRRARRRWPWFLLGGCCLGCCLCVTVPTLLVGAGGAILASVLDATSSQTFSQTLDVDPGRVVSLVVDNPSGEVTIKHGQSDQIIVEYKKRAYALSKRAAENALDDATVKVDQSGDTVTITTDNQSSSVWAFTASVDLAITVPPQTLVDVTNDAGEIKVILPAQAYIMLDAETDTGGIDVVGLVSTAKEERSRVVGATWQGTIGEGEGTPPLYKLRVNAGNIRVEAERPGAP
jgi:hypothetical protein